MSMAESKQKKRKLSEEAQVTSAGNKPEKKAHTAHKRNSAKTALEMDTAILKELFPDRSLDKPWKPADRHRLAASVFEQRKRLRDQDKIKSMQEQNTLLKSLNAMLETLYTALGKPDDGMDTDGTVDTLKQKIAALETRQAQLEQSRRDLPSDEQLHADVLQLIFRVPKNWQTVYDYLE